MEKSPKRWESTLKVFQSGEAMMSCCFEFLSTCRKWDVRVEALLRFVVVDWPLWSVAPRSLWERLRFLSRIAFFPTFSHLFFCRSRSAPARSLIMSRGQISAQDQITKHAIAKKRAVLSTRSLLPRQQSEVNTLSLQSWDSFSSSSCSRVGQHSHDKRP